ncbi:MAG: TonB-dependent receptor, partial [Tateyamaria sp.]
MKFSHLRGTLLSGVSIIAATAALAQDADTTDFFDLGSIDLYGDRTGNTLEQTASSVAVITAEELDSPTIQTVEDVFRRIANVQAGAGTESGFIIRGISSEGLTPGGNSAPLASIYIDGVQQTVEAARRGFSGVFDVEQVEVYRGPQSTLGGRNALAGAIYLRTKDPEFAESGALQLTFGEDNRRQVGLAYGNAINDSFAYRLSGEFSTKDSDLNFPTYQAFGGLSDLATDEFYNLRGKLLWQPADNAQTRAVLSYSHSFESPTTNNIAGPGSDLAVSFDDNRGDIRQGNNIAFQDVRETRVNNAGLEITHDYSDALRLTALTSLSDSITDRKSINAEDAGQTFTIVGEFDQQIFSQEVRLNYDSGPVRWVAGAYAAHEDNSGEFDGTLDANPLIATPLDVDTTNRTETNNIALFGEVTYEFTPGARIVAGARLDYIGQDINATLLSSTAGFPVQAFTSLDTTTSDIKFLPKLGFEYDINADQSIAVVYQKGFRPGGGGIQPVGAAFGGTISTYEFDSEETDNLELSYRGSFIEGRLNVAGNLFYTDYQNQQVEVEAVTNNAFFNIIVNAGDSEAYGAEFDVDYQMSETLNLFGSVGLLRTQFKDFTFSGQDLSGQEFRNAPTKTISVGARWGRSTGWFANGVASYVGSQKSGSVNGAAVDLGGYTTVDASTGYAWDSSRLTFYANNLLDKRYFTALNNTNSIATLGDRREIGVRFDK